MSRPETAAHRTRDEIAEAIRSLSAVDWVRLRKAAAAFTRHKPVEAEDLLQEAFRRALDGGRNCPTHVDVVRFLAEAMRSIADGNLDKFRRQPPFVPVANHGADAATVDPPDPAPDAEQRIATSQETAMMKAALLSLFEDDLIAQIILEGIIEGMEGEELRELTELDVTAYQSKRKLIRRRIDKKFPEGWRP